MPLNSGDIPYFNHITTDFSKNVRFFLNIKNLQTVMQNIISESWNLNCDISFFFFLGGKNLYIPSFPFLKKIYFILGKVYLEQFLVPVHIYKYKESR